jgi:predicted transposase YdaD
MVIKDREREALVTMDGLYDGYILKYFAEGEAQGFEKGESQGLKTGGSKKIIKLIQRKLDKGRSFEQACAELDLTEEEIEEIRPEFTR